LFQLVSSKTGGAIVRSLADEKTFFASGRLHQFTPLESIEVFTKEGNISLSAVFTAMGKQESGVKPADPDADPEEIRKYFRETIAGLDEDRVHLSDMKKMLKWYGILSIRELLKFPETETLTADSPAPKEENEAAKENPENTSSIS